VAVTSAKRKLAFRPADGASYLESALESVAASLSQDGDAVRRAMRQGDCAMCDAVREQLARKIAADLGAVDASVQAVYAVESAQDVSSDERIRNRPVLRPGISLIVRVNRKTAALSSIVDSLITALWAAARPLSCPYANALCWMLDVQLVDDQQAEQRMWSDARSGSEDPRLTEIWRRQALPIPCGDAPSPPSG